MGDVCRSVPLLVSLRRAYPGARIDWLVQDSFREAIEAHPDLSEVVPFPRKTLGKDLASLRWLRVRRWVGSIRRRRYDLVLDAQGLFRSGLIAWLSGAAVRIGDRRSAECSWLFCNHRVKTPRAMHTVDRMLALLEGAGVPPVCDMRLHVPAGGTAEAAELVPESGEAFVVLAPTSRWPGKQWPEERFAGLAVRLLGMGVARIVVVGGPGEEVQCPSLVELAKGDGRVSIAIGRTSVGGLMGLIARSSLVVANDSAPVHMAVGFDRPLVALYGPTDVSRVGPYGRSLDVLQRIMPGDRFDHKNAHLGKTMMARISLDEVAAAAEARLGTEMHRLGPSSL